MWNVYILLWVYRLGSEYVLLYTISLRPVYNLSLYAFDLGQIISTVLGQVGHDGQHGNAARTPIRDKPSETDHTQKRRPLHIAIYQTIKALVILRCLYGS